jgi:hypothetical protein
MVVRQLIRLACRACSISVIQLVKCKTLGGIANANGCFQFLLLARNYMNDENYKSPEETDHTSRNVYFVLSYEVKQLFVYNI